MKIGIMGGGQLGRMLALAGHPLGLDLRVLEPSPDCPAARMASHLRGEYEDFQALYSFCQGLGAITYEFENVPVESAEWLNRLVPVYPPPPALRVAQDRILEKSFFRDLGIAVPPFAAIDDRASFDQALGTIGLPAVIKTTRFGYDGKGQMVIRSQGDAAAAWEKLSGRQLILEGFVPFERELSIIGVRSQTGEIRCYPLTQNVHRDGILRQSTAPAPGTSGAIQAQAEAIMTKAMTTLNYVGVLAIELFDVGGQLMVNEMAPRVHNSGHWTIEGAVTSQFANHMRAVAGLPLGNTEAIGPAIMINLIGQWPDPMDILAIPNAHLHLYGKSPRPGRKVGHITITGPRAAEGAQQINELIEKMGN